MSKLVLTKEERGKSHPWVAPGFYKHSKSGRLYKVLHNSIHSETLEPEVCYVAMYESDEFGACRCWHRPVKMWNEPVEIGSQMVPRFQLIEPPLSREELDEMSKMTIAIGIARDVLERHNNRLINRIIKFFRK